MKNFKSKILIASVLLISMFTVSCKKDKDTGPHYNLTQIGEIELEKVTNGNFVDKNINILFQITNNESIGIANKTKDNFIIKEDGELVGSEAKVTIAKLENRVKIGVKTILLLDNSNSVEKNLDQIRAAAIAIVEQKPDYQEMAVYAFAGKTETIQEMTADKEVLKTAISKLTINQIDPGTTNLYGALIDMSKINIWEEETSIDAIRRSNLICFTDGDDVAKVHTLNEALTELTNKKVYMLGLGSDLDAGTMNKLGQFHSASDITKLEEVFLNIQADIENTANSYYWLYYTTPNRSSNNIEVKLEIKDNSNGSSTGFIQANFTLADFDKI